MKLKANFIQDWHNHLKEIMIQEWGLTVNDILDYDLPIIYFNYELRRIDTRKRKVKVSDVFNCPPRHLSAWNEIKQKISNGIDITPHLSKLINRSDKKDPMLNDWGVYHFHLGTQLRGEFIERTGDLLFALVKEDCFYAINIYSHGQWTNKDIVEVIHNNWSQIIEPYKITSLRIDRNQDISSSERQSFRENQINSYVQVSDGTAYLPIGGGITLSGHNIDSSLKMIHQHKLLEHLQSHLAKQLPSLKPDLVKQGYNGDPELEANLQITETEYKAFFPKYSLSVILSKNEQS